MALTFSQNLSLFLIVFNTNHKARHTSHIKDNKNGEKEMKCGNTVENASISCIP